MENVKNQYRYHVQVGLFWTYNSAMILQLRLIEQGYLADINKRGDSFAVQAGDFEEMERAVVLERHLRFLGYNTLLVAV